MVHSANNLSLFDLSDLPDAERYFVAFSGGIDSTALIHFLSQIKHFKHKLTAIHINHNIDPNSNIWAEQCQKLSHQLQIPIIIESVQLPDHSENSCRVARHQVFKKYLTGNDCLLTGHHQLDQIETMLFRLLRGTGLHGLTGMKKLALHHMYSIFRPMLTTQTTQIREYVEHYHLTYVEDPSNLNNKYSRNFIRNKLIPLLQSQNQNVLKSLELTRSNLFHSNHLLNTLIGNQNPLDVSTYLSPDVLMSALYQWINIFDKPSPSHQQLNQFAQDCLTAASDKNPRLSFASGDLIRWGENIYWLLPDILDRTMQPVKFILRSNIPYSLPQNNGKIQLTTDHNIQLSCEIKYQLNAQSIHMMHQTHSQKLKKLFQAKQTPPWKRLLTPYFFIDDKLMAVGNNFIDQQFYELLSTHNAEYQWLSPRFLL